MNIIGWLWFRRKLKLYPENSFYFDIIRSHSSSLAINSDRLVFDNNVGLDTMELTVWMNALDVSLEFALLSLLDKVLLQVKNHRVSYEQSSCRIFSRDAWWYESYYASTLESEEFQIIIIKSFSINKENGRVKSKALLTRVAVVSQEETLWK